MGHNENGKNTTTVKGEINEPFCGACLSVPLALVGAGTSIAGTQQGANHKKRKRIMITGGIISIVLSILFAVYFLFIKKCTTCNYKNRY